ncbi:TRAP transporter large permease [Egibacter rhizosphaerae]|uniref:TRAP transporter large permease n=1 Tax=Egibacter rhizosphaerae TaxID=1670831 RepID=UPI0013F167F3|nr:TRAP transporter large permease subunit [Egibacter rhizosphaerae]
MEWPLLLAAFLGALIILLLLRVPVAIALLGVNLVGVVWLFGWDAGTRQLVLSVQGGLSTFVLSPVPLFILMGEVLMASGLASRALSAVERSMGRLPGRLGLVTTAGGTLFGILSGSTLANTALLGKAFLPQMLREGYGVRYGMGSILASGGLAMIIPPSALAVVWGATAGVAIGPLLIGGLLPGLLMAVNYAIVLIGWSWLAGRRSRRSAPVVATEGATEGATVEGRVERSGDQEATRDHETPDAPPSLLVDVAPLALLIALVLGLIFFGVATPTESAAAGAVGSVVLAAAYRRLGRATMWSALVGSAKVSAVIFFILAGSDVYSRIMSFSGATSGVIGALLDVDAGPIVTLILMQVAVVLLGLFLEQISIMLVTLPFFMPVVEAMGWHPVWFGIIMLINLQIALTTPPFGMSLFVMKGVAPRGVKLTDVYLAAVPFVLADVVAIALLILVPGIALWLPELML